MPAIEEQSDVFRLLLDVENSLGFHRHYLGEYVANYRTEPHF